MIPAAFVAPSAIAHPSGGSSGVILSLLSKIGNTDTEVGCSSCKKKFKRASITHISHHNTVVFTASNIPAASFLISDSLRSFRIPLDRGYDATATQAFFKSSAVSNRMSVTNSDMNETSNGGLRGKSSKQGRHNGISTMKPESSARWPGDDSMPRSPTTRLSNQWSFVRG